MREIESIISYAIKNKISDIHLSEGFYPYFRKNGTLAPNNEFKTVTSDIIYSLLGDREKTDIASGKDADFALSLCEGRQRVNVYRQSGRLAMAIRLLSEKIPSIDSFDMMKPLKNLLAKPSGLILVTGPTGSGKSTTLASMIEYLSLVNNFHIITIEDPVEYQYKSGNSLINQREVGLDVESFALAIRSALREDPDVLLVGEMRDHETMSAAITAAETGHLVLSTLHTTGAARTIERIIDSSPAEGKSELRTQLSGAIQGIITQRLVPLADGSGRIAAMELLIATDAIRNLIREGKTYQIASSMQSGAALGMKTMEAHLADLVRNGKITRETAYENTSFPSELSRYMNTGF